MDRIDHETHLTLTINGVEYDLPHAHLEIEYTIDGVDFAGSYWEPPESAYLIAERVLWQDPSGDYAEVYLEETGQVLPLKDGQDIRELIPNIERLERDLHQEMRDQAEYDRGDYLASLAEDY